MDDYNFNHGGGQKNYGNRNSYNNYDGRNNWQRPQEVDLNVKDEKGAILNFNSEWVRKGADNEMIAYTKAAGKIMKNGGLSTSKIRGIFGEIKRIQVGGYDDDKYKMSFFLLQPKVAYAVGREKKSAGRNGNTIGIQIFQDIFDKAARCVTDKNSYQNFCNLMEALVAYHKYFGGE